MMERQMPQTGPFGEHRLTTTKEMISTGVCERMIISVASGKGGTGKTTIATSLAAVLGSKAQLLDCDVEEPNCHILMKPVLEASESITVRVPIVDKDKCTLCGKCGEVCRFSAIVVIGDQVLTFPEMCHGCGGCSLLCPENAIGEGHRELGVIETGRAGSVDFVHGLLRVGEAMSPPLIRAVKEKINPEKIAILDAPPGASCPVINTVMGSDFIILVTEPTPFGLHDLKIAVEALAPLEIPCGIILNRSDVGDQEVQRYCAESCIPVLAEIPHSRKIAEGYATGNLLVVEEPAHIRTFLELLVKIREIVAGRTSPPKEAVQ
jgi:MinD superfamily P-loop ATPase